MIQYLNVFFYDIYPYLCGTVFILGSWLRYDYGQYTWRAASSQMLDKRGMVLWSNLFHIGAVVELVPYRHFGDFLRAPVRHVNATLDVRVVSAGGGKTADGDDPRRNMRGIDADWRCGVLTLIGGAGLLVRRLTNPRIRATSSGADILILAILLIQCILGLTTIPFSAQHPDGSEMMKLVGWAQSIVTFQGGASTHLDGVAFIFRVHLVLGMTIFLLFPFTRLVHVWSAPFEYFTRRYQIVRSRR